MEVNPREILMLETIEGKVPFEEWFNSIQERAFQIAIDARLTRVADGNFGRSISMPSKPYTPFLLGRLKDPDYAVGYLTEVLQSETQEAFLIALRNVIDARKESVAELAKGIGVTRQGLYKMLSDEGNPRLSTLRQLLKSLGMKITISGDSAA